MPLENSFRLKYAKDIAKLAGRTAAHCLQLVGQDSQGELFSFGRSDGVGLFTFEDVELVTEDQDLKILFMVR